MTDNTTETIEQRQQKLQEELAEIERQQREQAEQERQQRQAERQTQLDPAMQEQAAAIEARAKEALDREYPPPWRPHKGGSGDPVELVGMVTNIDPQVGPSPQFGTYSAAVELVTTAGEHWTIWMDHGGALFSQLRRQRIQPGDLVAVRFRGKKKSDASGFTYNDYRLVRVDDHSEPQQVDYDRLALAAGEREALPAAIDGTAIAVDDDIPF